MKRRDISLTLALCGSLLAHALILVVLAHHYVSGVGHIRLSADSSTTRPTDDNRAPIIVLPPEIPDSPNAMGESTGKGYASNSGAGDDPMRAREGGEDQAYLSLDPVGLFGTDGGASSESALASAQPSLPPPPVVPPTEIASPFGIRASELDSIPPARPVRVDQATSEVAQAASHSDAPPGDPAPLSDSESDPFAKIGSANFRPGAIEARFGRKVKTVRPRLTIAGQYDLAALQYPSVQLTVRIDDTGKVTSADILRSSGSNQIDLPCQQAMYEWWIEPPKDKDGKPIADVMVWLLSFR
jgi:TonB family protein